MVKYAAKVAVKMHIEAPKISGMPISSNANFKPFFIAYSQSVLVLIIFSALCRNSLNYQPEQKTKISLPYNWEHRAEDSYRVAVC